MTTAIPRLGAVVLDCPDPRALAGFYARLLDWQPARDDDGWSTLEGPDGPPTWPDSQRPQMFHLDLLVADLDAAHDRAIELGATLLDRQRTFRVYADPAGHPFCLCAG